MIILKSSALVLLLALAAFLFLSQSGPTRGADPAHELPHASMSSDETAIPATRPRQSRPSKSYEGTGQRSAAKMEAETAADVWRLLRLAPLTGIDVAQAEERPMQRGAETLQRVSSYQTKDVIGDENRQPVGDTGVFPYRAIVLVESNAGRCTGWLYGKDIVATAGHCVHGGGRRGKWYENVVVYPGRNDETQPYGQCKGRRLYSVAGWVKLRDERYDYGAIKLDCDVGNMTGWFGVSREADVTDFPAEVVGYPASKLLQQWTHTDRVRKVSDLQIFYQNDTGPGTSGGPVFHELRDCGTCSMSVHAYGLHDPSPHVDHNHGVQITPQVYDTMMAWRDAT